MNDPTLNAVRKPDLLIVDDDPLIRDTLDFVLSRDFAVSVAESREQARGVMRQFDQPPQLALVDLGLPPSPHRPDEGFRLIAELVAYAPEMKIIVLSGQSDDANARHARTLGAVEFVAKPADPATLKKLLLQALQAGKAEKSATGVSLLGYSMPVEKLRRKIMQFAASPFPVLVQGESGSGKELVARALHRHSPRSSKPFVAINTAAMPKDLLESELFGHERGAFTGAQAMRRGRFEQAEGGTLFLDEIGDLPVDVQPKLLRFLEQSEIMPIGDTRPQRVDVRVLAATNADLEQRVAEGKFREDLYYRLSVIRVHVPPLRERRDEIPHLTEYFLRETSERLGKPDVRISSEALDVFTMYWWPGNVRQLRNEVQRAVALARAGDTIEPAHLSQEIIATRLPTGLTAAPATPGRRSVPTGISLAAAVEQVEREMIQNAIDRSGGNMSEAARFLGLTRRGLYLKLRRLGIGTLPRRLHSQHLLGNLLKIEHLRAKQYRHTHRSRLQHIMSSHTDQAAADKHHGTNLIDRRQLADRVGALEPSALEFGDVAVAPVVALDDARAFALHRQP